MALIIFLAMPTIGQKITISAYPSTGYPSNFCGEIIANSIYGGYLANVSIPIWIVSAKLNGIDEIFFIKKEPEFNRNYAVLRRDIWASDNTNCNLVRNDNDR